MLLSIPFVIIVVIATLFILVASGFVFFSIFKSLNRVSRDAVHDRGESRADGKRRVIDILSTRSPDTTAFKCAKCGATVDSTAELSPDGKVRCNYCNEWSSIL